MIDDLSRAVITSVSHGYTEQLVRGGVQAEWIPDNDGRVVFQKAVELYREGKRINALSILVRATGELQNVSEVKHLFSLNGTGDVPAADVSSKLRDHHLATEATKLNSKIGELLAKKPTEISQWLPVMAQRVQSLNRSARAYDPRPSAHSGKIVSAVMFKSLLPTYNRMFSGRAGDGGGYREAWWNVWIAPTGAGKTATALTIGCDGIKQGKRIAYVIKERIETVKARLLLGLTHLTMDEINNDQAIDQAPMFGEDGSPVIITDESGNNLGEWHKQTVRQYVLNRWKEALDSYCRIYPWKYFGVEYARQIISWDDPSLLIVDYIGQEDSPAKMDIKLGLGQISAGYEDVAHTTAKNISAFFQMSNAEVVSYRKDPRHIVVGPYGSGAVTHSADMVIQTRRGNMPNQQHYLKTKCRAGGDVEEFMMAYDKRRWMYVDMPEPRRVHL